MPPPGWYLDAAGQSRWWDGTRWTEHVPPVVEPDGRFARWRSTDVGLAVIVVGGSMLVGLVLVTLVYVAGAVSRM